MIKIETPERWQRVRLSSLFMDNTTKNSDFKERKAFQFFFGSIVPKKEYELTEELIEIYKKYTIVNPGDIMINGLNLNYDFVSQRVGLVTEKGIITSAYLSLRPRTAINSQYYAYLFKAIDAQKMFHGLGTGIRLTLSYKEIKNLQLPIPSQIEQEQIVSFLDWKVSAINKLINIKRKEIALFREQRQRKLSQVVTQGLNSNVPMKETGIKWVGRIPEHWQCLPLKRCARVRSGITLGKKYPAGTELIDVPYLRVANVQNGHVNLDTVITLKVTPEEAEQYQLPVGCVLMTEGGDRDKLGRGCVWNGEIENCIHQNHIFAVTVNDTMIQNNWLEYVSASDVGRVYFDVTAIRTTNLACTNASKVLAFPIPLPPRDEQDSITAELKRMLAEFDSIQSIMEKQIDSLQELKLKLIADVATGRIDVRNVAIPDYDYVTDEVDASSDEDDEMLEAEEE